MDNSIILEPTKNSVVVELIKVETLSSFVTPAQLSVVHRDVNEDDA